VSAGRRLSPPGGMAPPVRSELPGGTPVDLLALARTVAEAHRAEFPDEAERYGPAGLDWCVHDNQHILNWAVRAAGGHVELGAQITWLARVLEARDYPLDRLARDLELAAGALTGAHEEASAGRAAELLRAEAERVRATPTFLDAITPPPGSPPAPAGGPGG
jgi:hypothetical protein